MPDFRMPFVLLSNGGPVTVDDVKRFAIVLIFLSGAIGGEVRTWTDEASGRKLEAEIVSTDETSVTLRRASDGRRFVLPLETLSEKDRAFAAEWGSRESTGGMPRAEADRWRDLKWKSVEDFPVAGDAHERFDPVDKAIADFMVEKGIGALVAAVSRGGEVVYDRAFGFQDDKLAVPLRVGTSMRLASISKPIVAATVKTMLRSGKMSESDTVWDLLELEAEAPPKLDKRWKDVTVGHLLKHEGGWDRDVSGDVMFMAPTVAKEMRTELDELTFENVFEWMLERPLDFDPGAKEAYSNFGYNLLAMVAASVSGMPWEKLVNETVASEAGMTTLVVSPTEVENRVAGEIWYHYHPEYGKEPSVMPFRTEIQYGSGSLSCSAADLCRFLEKYWISGEPRNGNGYTYNFFGSMPGTTSVCGQRKDGVNFAVITNRRDSSAGNWNEELKKAMDQALADVKW